MATVHPIRPSEAAEPESVVALLARLARLEGRQLDAIERRLPHGWWVPYASVAGALAVGFLLSRVPFFRLVNLGAKAVQTGLVVAHMVTLVDRHVAERRRWPAA